MYFKNGHLLTKDGADDEKDNELDESISICD